MAGGVIGIGVNGAAEKQQQNDFSDSNLLTNGGQVPSFLIPKSLASGPPTLCSSDISKLSSPSLYEPKGKFGGSHTKSKKKSILQQSTILHRESLPVNM